MRMLYFISELVVHPSIVAGVLLFSIVVIKYTDQGQEVAQWLRGCGVLPKDQSSVPRTHNKCFTASCNSRPDACSLQPAAHFNTHAYI